MSRADARACASARKEQDGGREDAAGPGAVLGLLSGTRGTLTALPGPGRHQRAPSGRSRVLQSTRRADGRTFGLDGDGLPLPSAGPLRRCFKPRRRRFKSATALF